MSLRTLCLNGTALFSVTMLTACATIVAGTNQTVGVRTVPSQAASCALRNDIGEWRTGPAPTSVVVKRSSSRLHVTCGGPEGSSTTVARAGAEPWTLANIVIGGIIGWGVDGFSGAMFKYDDEIIVAMDQSMGGGAPAGYAPAPAAGAAGQTSFEPNVMPQTHPSYYNAPTTWNSAPSHSAMSNQAEPTPHTPAQITPRAPAQQPAQSYTSQPGLLPLPPAYPPSSQPVPAAPATEYAPAPIMAPAPAPAPLAAPAFDMAPAPAVAPSLTPTPLANPALIQQQPTQSAPTLVAPKPAGTPFHSQQSPYLKPSRY